MTIPRPTYTAEVTRDGRFWLITIRELDIVTQARFEGEVEEMARDLIVCQLDVAADSFDLRIVRPYNEVGAELGFD